MCAAIAVNHLNSNAIDLKYSRDSTVSAAGIVVFLGLLTMLMEGVMVLLRLVNKGAVNTCVVSVLLVLSVVQVTLSL